MVYSAEMSQQALKILESGSCNKSQSLKLHVGGTCDLHVCKVLQQTEGLFCFHTCRLMDGPVPWGKPRPGCLLSSFMSEECSGVLVLQ